MESLALLFAPLHIAINRMNLERGYGVGHPWHCRLDAVESHGSLGVEYRGEYELCFDDGSTVAILHDLLGLLASDGVSPRLRSFAYSTDAALAANGTYSIVIDPLLARGRRFPKLTRFALDQGEGEHGYKILASALDGGDGFYDEAGALAKLLERGPGLRELVTPSPPSPEFFLGDPHPLQSLDVDAGFGHEDFIRHLSGCSRFPDLRRLAFTDYRQRYRKDWRERTTSFADYESFFASGISRRLESVALREVNLTPDRVRRLLDVRSEGVGITRSEVAG